MSPMQAVFVVGFHPPCFLGTFPATISRISGTGHSSMKSLPRSRKGPTCTMPDQFRVSRSATAALTTQALLTVLLYFMFSHLANTPLPLQSSHCSNRISIETVPQHASTFPCDASFLRKAAHLATHLHAGLSPDPIVLFSQLCMLAGIALSVTDLLKVWGPGAHPLLPGTPTTVHSPLRLGISLGVRLGGPLMEVTSTFLAKSFGHADPQHGFQMLDFGKIRIVCLGLLVTNSLTYAFPWRTQLWLGPPEVVLLLTAIILGSGHWPARHELPYLVGYGLAMYLVPLVATYWQQRLGLQATSAHHRAGRVQLAPVKEVKQKVPCSAQVHDGAGPEPSSTSDGLLQARSSAGSGSATPRGRQQEQEQEQGQVQTGQEATPPPSPGTRHLPPQQGSPRRQGMHLLVDVTLRSPTRSAAPVVPSSTLYTSTSVTHRTLSVKVHCPTRSHEDTARALKQALATHLPACQLDQQVVRISTTWVTGCVHLFAWVSTLNRHGSGFSSHSHEAASGCQSAEQMPLAHPASGAAQEGVNDRAHDEDAAPLLAGALSNTLAQQLAAVALAAGAAGVVDVQIGVDTAPLRYQMGPAGPVPASFPEALSSQELFTGSDLQGMDLISVAPPCITLPDLTSSSSAAAAAASAAAAAAAPNSITLTMHLSSPQAHPVRVLVVDNAKEALLVDRACDVTAGTHTTLPLEVPTARLLSAAQTGHGSSAPRPTPLRLMLISPPSPHRHVTTDDGHPPPRPQLVATATLLAAPAPLASELCSLYEAMQDQGQAAGLEAHEVWSQHWQVLMHDVSLCLLAADDLLAPREPTSSAPASEAPEQHTAGAIREVAGNLHRFFSSHAMVGWEAQMQAVLQACGGQQEGGGALGVERLRGGRPPTLAEAANPVGGPAVGTQCQASASGCCSSRQAAFGTGHASSMGKCGGREEVVAGAEANGCQGKPHKPELAPAGSDSSCSCSSSSTALSNVKQGAVPLSSHLGLYFRDRAQEQRYRDWAMTRAHVPILVWCALFLGILLACMLQSFRAGSLSLDMPCYSALAVSHMLVGAAALWGSPAQLEWAVVVMYAIRASACALCGLGVISWPAGAHKTLVLLGDLWLELLIVLAAQMRALMLVVPLALHTLGEATLYMRLGMALPLLRPLVVNAICLGVAGMMDVQRRKLYLRSVSSSRSSSSSSSSRGKSA